MTRAHGLGRRLAAGILLLGVLAAAGLHHHEDLWGVVSGAPLERVISGHSPLSSDAHWHSGIVVKDDPCLACQSQRSAGVAAEPCRETPLALALFHATPASISPVPIDVETHGSRGPPALL
ncbi:MAG TPA: hypothetical protein VKG23_20570 [Thermoanaerobaculia bacterium]|nr:hypothetical protein [Thermoanaerobaculia bacterium]